MKNIAIIGHSSGIGNELTKKLCDSHRIYGTYCNHEYADDHENVFSSYLNILDESLDFSFLPEVLDGLVYCPGAITLKPLGRTRPEDFIDDYKLQVMGAIECIKASLAGLKKSKGSSIVLFSTVAVQIGFPFHSIVSASKGAIEGLTKSLAAELAPKIRVNCIAPSITSTPLSKAFLDNPEKLENSIQRHPLKKIGDPQDISNMAAYLLGSESNWITGQIFHIDGGLSTIK